MLCVCSHDNRISIFIYFDYNFDFISQKSQKELYLSQRPPPLPSYTLSNITHKPTTNNNNKLRATTRTNDAC